VQKEARELGQRNGRPGYRVHGQVEDAWELGVPQMRKRQLIVGVRNDLPGYFVSNLKPAPRAEPRTCLGTAIGDLPILRANSGKDVREYDFVRRGNHLRSSGKIGYRYLFSVLEAERAAELTNHVSRPHSARDLRDFKRLREGENSAIAMRVRKVAFEFPYDKTSFKDRYTRQSRWRPCSTIVAHLSKDGLMFIHPTQNRSLTPREAARIQSFPDWFRFPSSRTSAFRLIGNAVPPLVAEAVGLAVREFWDAPQASGAITLESRSSRHLSSDSDSDGRIYTSRTADSPGSRISAASELECLARLDRRALRSLPTDHFLRGWHALLYLFPGLHPDNALDHGDDVETISANQLALPGFEALLAQRYSRSGWPVALELIGREAWRRFSADQLSRAAFYCVEAQRAGLANSRPPWRDRHHESAGITKEN